MIAKTALDKCLDFIEDPRDIDIIWYTGQDARKELADLRKRLEEAEEIITMAAHMVSRDEKEAVGSLALEYVREYEVEG